MFRLTVPVLYLLFFLSGAAALVYQVVWVRSLSLVFGGSHLAVTTVLSVFMGGLALGSWLFGRRADAAHRPLRLYAKLELGVAASAAAFYLLLQIYPLIYVPLARIFETSPLWLTTLRVALASLGMIVPTTLMGGTLPVLSRFVAARPEGLSRSLAFLYALNTLGAVAGTLAAGFALLPKIGVTRSVIVALAVNLGVGAVAWLLPERIFGRRAATEAAGPAPDAESAEPEGTRHTASLPFRLVLLGIGISGFCALGYEVLWTRVLTLVVGTSVYSFTILLAAFLTGIAAGGQSEALIARMLPSQHAGWKPWVAVFGAAQLLIGLSALAVTWALRDLPAYAVRLQGLFRPGAGEFQAQQVATFIVAFAFMAVPAFFMGLAFPVAGNVHATSRGMVGRAVGEVLTYNTVGAIVGAALSGFVLIYLFGFERSLQLLALGNIGLALAVFASLLRGRAGRRAATMVVAASVAAAGALAVFPEWGRAWDRRFFAIFRNNQYGAFDTKERIRDALENTDVLYFHEGINETISVIRPRGAEQGFIVNGRVEASTSHQDKQCQRTLGHLPMLAHPNPRKIFVLGTGTAMTLGATTIHPEAEEIVLAEIEPGVLPAARTFAEWNHRALDNPKVRAVFNDGRNYLQTTRERFDVITADPIHPWSGGASYLYTDEYFRLAARRLNPGGLMCQWLPIYELNVDDLRSVVVTFAANFRHVLLWLTHYDAELLGSNDPIVFDLETLDRRIARSPIREDLADVFMGSAREFLSYFVAGTASLREFSRGAVLNTDDNLWLEFHAPRSRMISGLIGDNVTALTRHREGWGSYVNTPSGAAEDGLIAARLYDRAHALYLWGKAGDPEFAEILSALRSLYPNFAPGMFLKREVDERTSREPIVVGQVESRVLDMFGAPVARTPILLSVVTLRIGPSRGVVMVVDNAAREIYGERYVDASEGTLDGVLQALARRALAGLNEETAPRTKADLRERIDVLLRTEL